MRHALLALVLLTPLFACPGDDEGETAATTVEDTTTSGGTTAAASTGEPGNTTGSSGAESTDGSSGPADGDSTTAGGPSPVDACTASCEHLVKCGVEDVPNCGIPCASIGAMIGDCEAEYLAQQECVAALSCEDLQAWADAMMAGTDYPCATEDGAFQDCLGGGAGSSSGSG
jgi:hypothetical protein